MVEEKVSRLVNVKDLRDGDVIVIRAGYDSDEDLVDVGTAITMELHRLNPEAECLVVTLRPGDHIEMLSTDEMQRFGWVRET